MVDAVPFAVGQTARLETEISPEAEHQAGFGHLYPSLPMQRVDQDGCFLLLNFHSAASVRPHLDLGADHLDVAGPRTPHRVCGSVAETVRRADFQDLRPGASGPQASSNAVAVLRQCGAVEWLAGVDMQSRQSPPGPAPEGTHAIAEAAIGWN